MKLTAGQKRALLKIGEPPLRLLYFGYRLLSLDLFRDHRLPRREDGTLDSTIKKILVVRLDTIGDVLLSEPAIAALRQRFPRARIDVVVNGRGQEILSANPHIDSFILYDAPWHAAWRGQPVNRKRALAELWRVMRRLRREGYDLAIELRGDFRDIVFTTATGPRIKVGSGWRGGGFLLDYDVPHDVEEHRVDFALRMVGVVGARAEPTPPRIYITDAERASATQKLPKAAYRIAFHLGAGFPSKCLPVGKFAQVANYLCRKAEAEERQIAVIGGPEDRGLVEDFKREVFAEPVDLVGKLSVKETAAVLERCQLFIGNDSGPMHLAAAVGTPVVAFFGPSEPRHYRPYGVEQRLLEVDLPCRPCDHVHCAQEENMCLSSISVGDILAAAEELSSTKNTIKDGAVPAAISTRKDEL